MDSQFLKINGDPVDQETANIALMLIDHTSLFAGCCSCYPAIRLGQNPNQNRCPICGKEMVMHRIPSYKENFRLLFEAGYLVM